MRFAARNTPAIGVLEALVTAGANVNAASKTGIMALTAACRSNKSLASVLWLLEQGADPNLVPKDHSSPLLRAVRLKNTAMVKALFAAGADPEFVGKKGETARAIAQKKSTIEILRLLA
ncbi:MAG: ankyrin repeat domain-containing protein [Cyanobacteria bacterium P01_G01_bin.54]